MRQPSQHPLLDYFHFADAFEYFLKPAKQIKIYLHLILGNMKEFIENNFALKLLY